MRVCELLNKMAWSMKVDVVYLSDAGSTIDSTVTHGLYRVGDVINDAEIWSAIRDMYVDNVWFSGFCDRVVIEIRKEEDETE